MRNIIKITNKILHPPEKGSIPEHAEGEGTHLPEPEGFAPTDEPTPWKILSSDISRHSFQKYKYVMYMKIPWVVIQLYSHVFKMLPFNNLKIPII